MVVSNTSDHIQIKIKMPNSNQKPSSILQTLNQDLKDMDVLCTFKAKGLTQDLEHGYVKDQGPYSNQDQDAKTQSGTSSILQSPESGLEGYGWPLNLQNQYREPKLRMWANQRPVTIPK